MTEVLPHIDGTFLQFSQREQNGGEQSGSPIAIAALISALENAKSSILLEVRSAFTTAATRPSSDGSKVASSSLIYEARQLQRAISQHQDAAQAIAEKHAAAQVLRDKVADKQAHVALLERELVFNDLLGHRLDLLADATKLVNLTRDRLLVERQALTPFNSVLDELSEIERLHASIEAKEGRGAVVLTVLERQRDGVRDEFADLLRERWNQMVKIQSIGEYTVVSVKDNSHVLPDLVTAMGRLGILKTTIARFHRDLDNLILTPRLQSKSDGTVVKLEFAKTSIQVVGRQPKNGDGVDLMKDIVALVSFLENVFPDSFSHAQLNLIMPSLLLRLVSGFLNPNLPLNLNHVEPFKAIFNQIQQLDEFLTTKALILPSEVDLGSWLAQIPENWVARRTESALTDLRLLCREAAKGTLQVAILTPSPEAKIELVAKPSPTGDDEGPDENAWDQYWKTPGDPNPEIPEAIVKSTNNTEFASQPATPPIPKNPSTPDASTSFASTEICTVTAIPTTIRNLITSIFKDALTLQLPDFALSKILRPAASAMAAIPGQLLAFYRATAHSYYACDANCNMLIFNDAQHLINLLSTEFLNSISPDHPLVDSLRLDADLIKLEQFASRIYTKEMHIQKTMLTDILSLASGFDDITHPLKLKQYPAIVKDATLRVREVDEAWRNVLAKSLRLQSLGSLVEVLCSQLVSDILERADDHGGITKETSKLFKAFIDEVAMLQDLFEDDADVVVHTPGWFRCIYLGEILDANLADIKFLWTNGELALEFDDSEVIDLIEALFTDSVHRKEAVKVIRNHPVAKGNTNL